MNPSSAMPCILFLLAMSSSLSAQTRPLPAGIYSLRVKVLDDKGGPVQDVQVRLVGLMKGALPGLRHRKVPEQEPRALKPKDFVDGFARFDELPAGEFVLLVDAAHGARTLSEPFTIPTREEAAITVRLHRGGTLEGRVVGPDQKPVVGATVVTANPHLSTDQPLGMMLSNLLVDTLTSTSAVTGPDGTFRLEHLAHGSYRVIAQHPDFVPGELDAEVATDDKRSTKAIQLADGVLVTGEVRRGGAPVPGADVQFQFDDTGPAPGAEAMKARVLRVKADDQGRFRLPARVLPHEGYVLMAASPGSPLEQGMQFAASRVRFDVKAGEREHAETLQLR